MPGAVYCSRLFITSLCVCVCVSVCTVCVCVHPLVSVLTSWVPLLCLFNSCECVCTSMSVLHACSCLSIHVLGIREQMGAGVCQKFPACAGH